MTKEQQEIIRCARRLVARLKVVHAHPSYIAVWTRARYHIGSYEGPTYELELKALTKALKRRK